MNEQDAYVARVRAVANALTPYCSECGEVIDPATDTTHVLTDRGHVIVGCEGYWLVDPNLLGITAPNWSDWRRDSLLSDPQTTPPSGP